MPVYCIQFVDYRGAAIATCETDCRDDDEAIEHARRLDRCFIAMGFDLWASDRLVLRERT